MILLKKIFVTVFLLGIFLVVKAQSEKLDAVSKKQDQIITDFTSAKEKLKGLSENDASYSLFKQEAEKKAKDFTTYVATELDWSTLYTSEYWSRVINLWTEAYTQVLKNPYLFLEHFTKITEKIKDKNVYSAFAKETAYSLIQQEKEHLVSFISPIVTGSGKVDHYEGVLQAYIKAAVGTQAPDIILNENGKTSVLKSSELAGSQYNKTLLIFYLSECGPCAEMMRQMPNYYPEIEKRKIRIIAISGDANENTFREYSKGFLWKDTYLEPQGMKGINFKNYAVPGTPTLVLIDKQGKIVLRPDELPEIFKTD
jgi:thioredoxin-related protein